MNKVCVVTILFILTFACEQEAEEACFPDKGIETAKTYTKFDSEDNALELGREIHYDKDGRPLLVINVLAGSEHRREYKNGRLQSIITTHPESSEWSFSSRESLNLNSNSRKDTAIIVSHYKDGRPAQMKGIDSTMLFFDYVGCGYEVQTLLKENGDTMDQSQKLGRNLVEKHFLCAKRISFGRIFRPC